MTELEKLRARLEYCYDDTDYEAQAAQLEKMLGSKGEKVWIAKTFNCERMKFSHSSAE